MKKEDIEISWKKFCKLCLSMESDQELQEFFRCFLTIEEQEMVAARYKIIAALLEGKSTQRELAERYNVSISQITRGSNQLKTLSTPFREFLKEKMEE